MHTAHIIGSLIGYIIGIGVPVWLLIKLLSGNKTEDKADGQH